MLLALPGCEHELVDRPRQRVRRSLTFQSSGVYPRFFNGIVVSERSGLYGASFNGSLSHIGDVLQDFQESKVVNERREINHEIFQHVDAASGPIP
ncbi:hypothetical protein CMUS01_06017 [Colletotrichum musicola]|uniref:Uncharacterized protein n=1 Tax=Colletotrichum musicola TaxID=2175873 RepID=A0A8H6KPT6_9PEZI|nr:hypothetical protein CMUS01_06017 [Colletotrichum musicola]